jgi:tight adherence protein B
MNIELALLKWCGALCCLGAISALARALIATPDAVLARFARRHIARLDQRMRRQLLTPRGREIFTAQTLAGAALGAAALMSGELALLAAVPVVIVAPTLVLTRMHIQRRHAIEAQIDGFTVALANAMRASPSIPRALESVSGTTASPLREEIDLTLRELRVGSTLEQALGELGFRIGSAQFDATMSALLIGMRVGGDVPAILNDTAASLREIVKLQSTLRAKTADGRVQAMVLAAFPVLLAFGFDFIMPGYFSPLLRSGPGVMVALVAAGCWLGALVLARRVLAVQL